MVTLPEKYCENIKRILGEEGFQCYMESFAEKPLYALRVNTAKASLEEWKKICPFDTEEIPWCRNGFIINGSTKQRFQNIHIILQAYTIYRSQVQWFQHLYYR